MRVLVCGGRLFDDEKFVRETLDRMHKEQPFTLVIHGDARGVDTMAANWARENRIENSRFEAFWREWGKAAGPMRNKRMLIHGRPELVIAFVGGNGTADMVRQSCERGVKVIQPRKTEKPSLDIQGRPKVQ